jgi:hypothetical protein
LRMGRNYTFASPVCLHKYVLGFIFNFTKKWATVDKFRRPFWQIVQKISISLNFI